MFYRTQAFFPNMKPRLDQKGLEWQGKKIRIRWLDGSFTDYPALGLEHWLSLLRFTNKECLTGGGHKKKR